MYNEALSEYGINMNSFKAVLFGPERVGKTAIHQKLRGLKISEHYLPTLGADVGPLQIPNEEMKIHLWDTPSAARFKTFSALTLRHVDLGLYCIDLSEELTEEMIATIKSEIDELKALSPDAELILVGTKQDKASEQSLETARKKLEDIAFSKSISTTTSETNGVDELKNYLIISAKNKSLQEKIDSYKTKQHKNGVLFARNLCHTDSELYLALDNLYRHTKDLNEQTLATLGDITSDLIFNLLDTKVTDKGAAINSFVQQSEELLKDNYSGVLKGILTVAITAAVTVVAALIGFGIGFALGAWSGPGAFFTGLLAGSASAIAVVAGSSLVGLGSTAYTAYRFFSPSPVAATINEVAEQAQTSTLVAAN